MGGWMAMVEVDGGGVFRSHVLSRSVRRDDLHFLESRESGLE